METTIENPALLAEITIGWGEDTFCGTCLEALPAGAPAWAAGDDQPVCADCAPVTA